MDLSASSFQVIILLSSFLALVTLVTVASYCIGRRMRLRGRGGDHDPSLARRGRRDEGGSGPTNVVVDEAVLRRCPKLMYSQAKLGINEGNCSVCLGDYGESDVLRLLPDCGHVFHLKCVDPWLRLHPTCPLCRSSPRVIAAGRGDLDSLVTCPI